MTESDQFAVESAASHVVLRNDEQQYSVWPANSPVPLGWHQVGEPASVPECVDVVEKAWTDMRPASGRVSQGATDRTVPDLIHAQAVRAPNTPAVMSEDGNLSFLGLDQRADRLARRLRERGVRAESVVTVCLDRRLDLVVALLAVLRAGGAFLPLDVGVPRQRLLRLVEETDSAVVLSTAEHAEMFADCRAEFLDVRDHTGESLPEAQEPLEGPAPDDLAYVIYTSGSTGTPKGIMVTHRTLGNSLCAVAKEYGLAPGDRVLQIAALGFDTALEQIFATLISGATVVLAGSPTWAPTDLLDNLPKYRITVADLPPAYWHRLLTLVSPGEPAVSSLRLVVVGGEIVHAKDCRTSLRRIPGARLVNAYGLTETTITSTLCDVTEGILTDQGTAPAPVGRPVEGAHVYVLDAQLGPVPPRERGEVFIGGSQLARGIWRQPGLTATQFLPDPYGTEPGGRMYRTGDVGRRRPDGSLEIIGRVDDQMKVGGFRVNPTEVEAALLSHPAVHEAVVVAGERGDGEKDLVAYYTQAGPPPADRDELHRELKSHLTGILPPFMVPKRFRAVHSMPVTPNGKIDRKALPSVEPAGRSEGARPTAPIYSGMAHLWGQILNVEHIHPHDDFFELGGNSLLAMEMLARARIMFGIGVSQVRDLTRSLLHNSTLAAFAECARRARAGTVVGPDRGGVDFEAESEIKVSVRRAEAFPPEWRNPSEILLTGATGFCGAHMIDELLRSTTGRIHCLVRASDRENAWERIRSTYQRYVLRDLSPERINPIPGDLSKPNLGLSPGGFAGLGAMFDIIYHFGGQVNFIYPYRDLRAANVTATREIIRLAGARSIPVHYASSMAVLAGFGPAGVPAVSEETPLAFADYLSVGYVETKWVSEALLKNASDQGLPVAVYRLNDVTGSSVNGVMNKSTEVCALIKLFADSGCCPDVDLPLDFLPADYFARALTHISTRHPAEGKVYHLTNPRPALVGLLAECLRRRGYPVREIPYSDWVALLVQYAAAHPTHPIAPFVPLFVDKCNRADIAVAEMYLKSAFTTFTRTNTDQDLEGSGLEIPPVDAELLNRYIDCLRLAGYLGAGDQSSA